MENQICGNCLNLQAQLQRAQETITNQQARILALETEVQGLRNQIEAIQLPQNCCTAGYGRQLARNKPAIGNGMKRNSSWKADVSKVPGGA